MYVARPLLVILLLLNLLALATGQGWLGTSAVPGEPERLTNQIRPDLILLSPQEAPSEASPGRSSISPAAPPAESRVTDAQPTPAMEVLEAPGRRPGPTEALSPIVLRQVERPLAAGPHGCMVYAGIGPRQADMIERAAQSISPELRIARETIEPASGWWVRIPPAGSQQAAERHAQALRALGINDLFIIREAGPNQFAISLGLFRTEAGASQHLSDLESRRVRGAEIAVRTPPVLKVEIAGPLTYSDVLADRLAAALSQAGDRECL